MKGTNISGTYSILSDNEVGFRELLEHVIIDHNAKNVVFIKGPNHKKDVIERLSVFREVMKVNSKEVHENLIVDGDFSHDSGYDAISSMVDNGVDFDTVVACNDAMARGAMKALEDSGISVPSNIRVVGYDDVVEAKFSTPPLTTVAASIYSSGYKAVEVIYSLYNGEKIENPVTLPSEMVVRRSCGCVYLSSSRLKKHETMFNLISELKKVITTESFF